MTLLEKLERYCSYQDRCSSDVELKMAGWKLPPSEKEKLIRKLTEEGFIDDQRFARSFARGKFRVNNWGRIRIRFELKAKRIPESLIREALQEIGEEEYEAAIRALINKKSGEINPEKTLNKREKIINFVVGKGFEIDQVLRIIQETTH